MRFTQTLIPTLREAPADAEVPSHRLLLRAGYIRKLASGIYSYLPLGQRVLRKAASIVREEMDREGAVELLMPIAQPAELWKESGRYAAYTAEHTMFTLTDRKETELCLGPTHEEVVTDIVRHEVKSYRQLPLNLYQIQTKFRDELRPRFGLIRGREFLMKDAYSFDRDEAGLSKSFDAMARAYHRIFRRMGLSPIVVEADSGAIGGAESREFMISSETGEDELASCPACGYGANLERAEARLEPDGDAPAAAPREAVRTPDKRTVADVTSFLGKRPRDLVKTLLYVADGKPVAVLIRGDLELNEVKLKNRLKCLALSLADEATVSRVTHAPTGFAGPVGLSGVQVLADRSAVAVRNAVTGGNAKDTHYVNVNAGRDYPLPETLDLRRVREGDPCIRCGSALSVTRGMEVGHVFKLGTKYSVSMNARFADEDGTDKPFVMGCYGIGVSRCVAAAVEQNHDEKGIVWPMSLSPYAVHVIATSVEAKEVHLEAARLAAALEAYGIEVLYDDRSDVSAGVKFKDAELIGIPFHAVVGPKGLKEDQVEIKNRAAGTVEKISTSGAAPALRDLVQRAMGRLSEAAAEPKR